MLYVILTPVQANHVRGHTMPGHAIAPVLLADRTFGLPVSVIEDSYHGRYREYLLALPQVAELPPLLDLDTLTPIQRAFYDAHIDELYYNRTWPVGENVILDLGPL